MHSGEAPPGTKQRCLRAQQVPRRCVLLGVWYVRCRLVEEGVLKPQADIEVPEIPMDLAAAVKLKKVRTPHTVTLQTKLPMVPGHDWLPLHVLSWLLGCKGLKLQSVG